MQQLANCLERINTVVANVVRWLVLAMVLAQFAIVVGRYVFGVNSIAVQESVLYMHAALFMLAAGYTLLVNKHVRVDIFYTRWSRQWQRRVEIAGHLGLLIPTLLTLLYWSWPSVINSWRILEGPISVGGLQAVFLMKSLIPAFCLLLLLQSIACLIRLFTVRRPS